MAKPDCSSKLIQQNELSELVHLSLWGEEQTRMAHWCVIKMETRLGENGSSSHRWSYFLLWRIGIRSQAAKGAWRMLLSFRMISSLRFDRSSAKVAQMLPKKLCSPGFPLASHEVASLLNITFPCTSLLHLQQRKHHACSHCTLLVCLRSCLFRARILELGFSCVPSSTIIYGLTNYKDLETFWTSSFASCKILCDQKKWVCVCVCVCVSDDEENQ